MRQHRWHVVVLLLCLHLSHCSQLVAFAQSSSACLDDAGRPLPNSALPRIMYPHRHLYQSADGTTTGGVFIDTMPSNLTEYFTRCSTIATETMVVDETFKGKGSHYKFPRDAIDKLINLYSSYMGVIGLSKKKEKHAIKAILSLDLTGKRVAVIGSQEPWLESFLVSRNVSKVVTIEYNRLTYNHSQMETTTPAEYRRAVAGIQTDATAASTILFDFLIAIAAADHDGLGRYGDPIAPDGDFLSIDEWATWLKPQSGQMLVSVPIGPDLVVWNLERRYGRIRLPLLLQGFTQISAFGYNEKLLDKEADFRQRHEAAFVLMPQAVANTNSNDGSINVGQTKEKKSSIQSKPVPLELRRIKEEL